MFPQVQLLPGAISEIFASTSETRVLTLADRYGLMAATLDESISEEEAMAINRVLRAVVRGKIKISAA